MTATLTWDFPCARPHAGVPLGNGTLGLMIWSGSESAASSDEHSVLRLSVGRAGFWDHRGGNAFASSTTFSQVRSLLEHNDHAGLIRVFGRDDDGGQRPSQVGCGRIELRFPGGFRPHSAALHTGTGTARISLVDGAGRWATLSVRVAAREETAWIELPPGLAVQVTAVPAWEACGAILAKRGISPPERWQHGDDHGGWVQHLPEDDALACAWQLFAGGVAIATALGADAYQRAHDAAQNLDAQALIKSSVAWWHAAWKHQPKVELPDSTLQHAWDFGSYRFNAAVTEHGVPCTLQGPWLEDTQLPPWSCDYHFNINAQMIHQPAMPLGRTAQCAPLWKMLHGWLPQMRSAGRAFFGHDDALMLPHAVDDRCHVVGAFWSGAIDHACTGWMGLQAWQQYRHDHERWLLEEVAWPLLVGAHAGYTAMSEMRHGQLSLPVSVSPEFRGCRPDAWGADASFQLACWHAVLRALPQAAAILGRAIDPAWARCAALLPAYCPITTSRQREYPEQQVERIALWRGQDLIESHRHHSHLAGLWPFATIDADAPAMRQALWHWTRSGSGAWSGWAFPWASMLCARSGLCDAAVGWLRLWAEHFTNEGHGTLHDAIGNGISTLTGSGPRAGAHEIFQLDAGMGAVTAISELLVQDHGDTLRILPGLPLRWRALNLSGLHAAQGLRIGFTVENARLREVRIEATRDTDVRIEHGLTRWRDDRGRSGDGTLLHTRLAAGERLRLAAT